MIRIPIERLPNETRRVEGHNYRIRKGSYEKYYVEEFVIFTYYLISWCRIFGPFKTEAEANKYKWWDKKNIPSEFKIN
jgi:hypothetical protein